MRFGQALFISLVILTAAASYKAQTSDTFVSGEVLVKFPAGESAKTIEKVLPGGAEAVERLGESGWQRVKLPKGMPVEIALKQLAGTAGIENVQPNFYYHLLTTPNDPQFSGTGMYGL